ncbi:hypothetical protein ACFQRL_13405 [Microbacterium fluvii]|uniref:Thioredoxin-like fold domain-containing protein n=1 Tax=Microbacterium fluvii TaxID=415215 RepID=A0ABW2HFM4_9MICO|nr:hypothetical protein [Microbacterium fluvii]MCU4673587.1 hypothetical protein [Microbacterium fluvii]
MAKVTVDRKLVQGMTKRERQQFVREVRRAERERLAREKRRRRIIGWSAAGAVVVVAAAGVTVASVANAQAAAQAEADAAASGPANMASDGLLLTSTDGTTLTATTTAALGPDEQPTANISTASTTGVVDVQVYLDLTTADAATFWSTAGDVLSSYATGGAISIELHPIALDTGDADAVATAAAFGCVADAVPDSALDVWSGIVQTTADDVAYGLDFDSGELASIVSAAGVDDAGVTECLDDGGFTTWATQASERAAASVPYTSDEVDVAAGPVVVAAGTAYTGALDDVDAFTTFLTDAYTTALAGATTE